VGTVSLPLSICPTSCNLLHCYLFTVDIITFFWLLAFLPVLLVCGLFKKTLPQGQTPTPPHVSISPPSFHGPSHIFLCSFHSLRPVNFLSDAIIPPCLPILAYAAPPPPTCTCHCTSTHCPFHSCGSSMPKNILPLGDTYGSLLTPFFV